MGWSQSIICKIVRLHVIREIPAWQICWLCMILRLNETTVFRIDGAQCINLYHPQLIKLSINMGRNDVITNSMDWLSRFHHLLTELQAALAWDPKTTVSETAMPSQPYPHISTHQTRSGRSDRSGECEGLPASLLLHVHVYRSLGNTVEFSEIFADNDGGDNGNMMMLMMVLLLSFLIYKDVPLMMEIKQGAKKSMLCKG